MLFMWQAWNVAFWQIVCRGSGRTQTGYCSLKFKRLKMFRRNRAVFKHRAPNKPCKYNLRQKDAGYTAWVYPHATFCKSLYNAWGFILDVALLSFAQVLWDLKGITWERWAPYCQGRRVLVSDSEGLSASPRFPETSPLCTPARPRCSGSIQASRLQWVLIICCWFRLLSLSTAHPRAQFSHSGTCPCSPIAPSLGETWFCLTSCPGCPKKETGETGAMKPSSQVQPGQQERRTCGGAC